MNKAEKQALTLSVFNEGAETYQQRFMNVDQYQEALGILCAGIAEYGEVLDIACGPGNIAQYLLHQRCDLKLLGIDLSPRMVELAQVNNPAACFSVMDCRNISNLNKQFNAIVCAFCLPYLNQHEANQLIADAGMMLKPGGLIYLSTMEDDYAKSGVETSSSGNRLFVHYHEGGYLLTSLQSAGYTIVFTDRKRYQSSSGQPLTDLVIIAAK